MKNGASSSHGRRYGGFVAALVGAVFGFSACQKEGAVSAVDAGGLSVDATQSDAGHRDASDSDAGADSAVVAAPDAVDSPAQDQAPMVVFDANADEAQAIDSAAAVDTATAVDAAATVDTATQADTVTTAIDVASAIDVPVALDTSMPDTSTPDTAAPLTCQTADDCGPDQPCRVRSCRAGFCTYVPIAENVACGNGLHCDGAGACKGCVAASDCPGVDTECAARTCADAVCGFALATAGKLVAAQITGDCRKVVCDGVGRTERVVDDTDLPADDGDPCTDDLCKDGNATRPPKQLGSACNTTGGLCDSSGACTLPPSVVSTTPADGASVAVGASITVTFSMAMNPDTLVAQAAAGACTGGIQLSLNDFATCIALGDPQMSSDNTKATYTATPGLLANRRYKVRVGSNVRSVTGLGLASIFTTPTGFQTKSPDSCDGSVVLAQIYGGGGGSAADTPYQYDYVALHNRGTTTADLAGYSLQYGAASGDTWSSLALSGTIAPGAFFLVQLGPAGSQGQALPTPDFTGASLGLSATAGKVALVHATVAMPRNACPSADAVDFVGYGAVNCSRSSTSGSDAAPALNYLGALVRGGSGCVNTNLNASDFAIATPAPANHTTTAACTCLPVILNETGEGAEADKCSVEAPTAVNVQASSSVTIYAQMYEAGVTEASGSAPTVRAQLGVGPASRNPEYESGWTWTDATYDSQVGVNDRYTAAFTPAAAGSFRFVYRFSLDGGNSWTYCDGAQADGGAGSSAGLTFDLENEGTLTVTP